MGLIRTVAGEGYPKFQHCLLMASTRSGDWLVVRRQCLGKDREITRSIHRELRGEPLHLLTVIESSHADGWKFLREQFRLRSCSVLAPRL